MAKVLIVEKNCAQLIALTVWLQQFPQLHVLGTMSSNALKQSVWANHICGYDLIIYGVELNNSDDLPLELAVSLSLLRRLKESSFPPTLILLTNSLAKKQTNDITAQINQQLLKESSAHLFTTDSLNDCYETILKVLDLRTSELCSKVC